MIKDFMKVDVLGADGAFTCEACKKKRQGRRQSMLVNWPKVLVLHLCRFTYSGARNSQSVDFPARLDQSMIPIPTAGGSTSNGDPINGYSLSGVVLHRGTANFGHYTALVRPHGSRTWYHCDDSSVSTISESEVLRHRTEAYVLFYTMDEI
jgi:ubiquitin C-terminal hydrolase